MLIDCPAVTVGLGAARTPDDNKSRRARADGSEDSIVESERS